MSDTEAYDERVPSDVSEGEEERIHPESNAEGGNDWFEEGSESIPLGQESFVPSMSPPLQYERGEEQEEKEEVRFPRNELDSEHVLAWKEKNREVLLQKMKSEQETKKRILEDAKLYLLTQQEQRDARLQSRHESNAQEDKERLRSIAEEETKSRGEEVWDVICKRVDFKKAVSMNTKDLSRFRSVLLKKKHLVISAAS